MSREGEWSDPLIVTDHRLLRCSRVYTGKTIMLPARVPVGRKVPTLVQCRIYCLDTGQTVAIGQHDDLFVIFQQATGGPQRRF